VSRAPEAVGLAPLDTSASAPSKVRGTVQQIVYRAKHEC